MKLKEIINDQRADAEEATGLSGLTTPEKVRDAYTRYVETKDKPEDSTPELGRDVPSIGPPTDQESGRIMKGHRGIRDIVASGHGYRVIVDNREIVHVADCSECGLVIAIDLPLCEFHDKPFDRCKCNGCRLAAAKIRKTEKGRPRVTCSARCARKRKSRMQREQRQAA